MTSTSTTQQERPAAPSTRKDERGALRALIMRLHFYAGLFVGPFLIIAALSGALYALTPAMEEGIYDKELHVPVSQTTVPLADQIRAALFERSTRRRTPRAVGMSKVSTTR